MTIGAMDAYAIAYTDWSQRLGEEAERQLIDDQRPPRDVEVTTEVLFGQPGAGDRRRRRTNNADLIVMGTHGHGARDACDDGQRGRARRAHGAVPGPDRSGAARARS